MRLILFILENPTIFVVDKRRNIIKTIKVDQPLTMLHDWAVVSQIYLDWVADHFTQNLLYGVRYLNVVLPHIIYTQLASYYSWVDQLEGLAENCQVTYHSMIEAVVGHLSKIEENSTPFLFGHTAFGKTAFYELINVGQNFAYRNICVRSGDQIEVLQGVTAFGGEEEVPLSSLLFLIDESHDQIVSLSHDPSELEIDSTLEVSLNWSSKATFGQLVASLSNWGKYLAPSSREQDGKLLWLSSMFNYNIVKNSVSAVLEQQSFVDHSLFALSGAHPDLITSQLQSGLQLIIEHPTLITNNREFPANAEMKVSFTEGPVLLLSASDTEEPLASIPMPLPPLEITWGDGFRFRQKNWFPKPTADFTHLGKPYMLLGFNFSRSLCGDVSLIAETSDQNKTTLPIKSGCELNYE